MRRLSETVKRRIVEHLACYWSPGEVVELIAKEFAVEVTPRQVRAYDPTSFQCVAAPRLLDLHKATRTRFEREVAEIAIAHRAFRLRQLEKLYLAAEKQGNITLAANMLEQAAKEVGGMFTNGRLGASGK